MSSRVRAVLRTLARETRKGRYDAAAIYRGPIERRPTPWRALVGCLISQRARDEQTGRICRDLFRVAPTPRDILRLDSRSLRALIHGSGFFRQKARHLRGLARAVLALGGVPRTREQLLLLPGIGPKCANLVMARCFGAPLIAVDTHVHRISNRLGWVRTATPEATEPALTARVPVAWRRRVNALLVAHGQLVCKPVSPDCPSCPIRPLCARRGVAAGPRAR